jgi:glycosyltransferase involved in cell wall biosynthesis
MKILQVCSAESLGGGERHVAELTRALSERGHELHLAARPRSPLRAALADAPVNWHEVSLRNALDLASARHLAAIIRAERIEVLHAHLARDYPVCGLAAKLARPVRFFLTRHHFHPIKANPLYAWALSDARRLIAVSESVRAQLAASFPALAARAVVIPNWIDAPSCGRLSREAARARLGITRPLAVGIVGQLTPLKRQALFIKAAARAIKEGRGSDADFLVMGAAGPRDAGYEQRLRELARELGVSEQVRFTGHIADLPAHLAAFDIIAAPSVNEAFSLALAEAMAAGCAVLASRVGGMAEIAEGEVTGLLVAPDDEAAFIAGLLRLLGDERLRLKLGAAAQASVRERFDRGPIMAQIERLYREA